MNPSQAPWHAGEREMQARAGVAERMEEIGARFLRDSMPEQHRQFFPLLPSLYVGALDEEGWPCASMLAGPPGFVHSPDPRLLRVEARGDGDNVRPGAPVALLGVQAHTRRRNRMNGTVVDCSDHGFSVRVGQSFGNCPKYIHARELLHDASAMAGPAAIEELGTLDAAALAQVTAADTFFIASGHPQAGRLDGPAAGVDVSHRGGPAGFVQVHGPGTLLVPDYVGNSFFNTLGNLRLEPRCGLLFVDPRTGVRLQVAARAEVLWEGWDREAFPGALRVLRLQVVRATRRTGGLPLRWGDEFP
ncbi:MAG TPA: pyridoxamine 5'-phosphate oxidase family protein [Ramlibacter sp.]|nr:pyridoxamine 5'-phosphate oxidase family protein [Ramlibacter sp.]